MIEAYDLGEDGESWMVEGTLDPEAAERAVRELWVEQGVAEENNSDFPVLKFEPREDWWWAPVNEKYPDDDMFLMHGNIPEDKRTFIGVWVRS